MRKCGVLSLTVLAALASFAPGRASAQFVFLGAGPSFPVGDYGDYAKTGFLATGGIGFPVGPEGVSLFGEGYFGLNNHTSDLEGYGGKTYPYGAMAGLEYDFSPEGEAGVYAYGEVGFLVHKFSSDLEGDSSSDTGFAFGGGLGYGMPLGSVTGWAEGRFTQGQFSDGNTGFFAVMVGISKSIGGEM